MTAVSKVLFNRTFYNNPSINSVNLKNVSWLFNSASYGFYNCIKLSSISGLNPDIVNIKHLFFNCYNLASAPSIPSGVKDMSYSFYNCTRLSTLPSVPDSVTSMAYAFYNCKAGSCPKISNNVTNMCGTFAYCTSMSNTSFPTTLPNSLRDMSYTFRNCNGMFWPPDVKNTQLTTVAYCFDNCVNCRYLPEFPNTLTNMYHLTWNVRAESVIIPPNVTNVYAAFGVYKGFYLDLPPNISGSVWDFLAHSSTIMHISPIPRNVTSVATSMRNCYRLRRAPIFGTSITTFWNAFNNSTSVGGNIFIYSNKVSNVASMFTLSTYAKYVYIPFKYANGVNTATYNTFTAAGYTTSGSQYNVFLMDLSSYNKINPGPGIKVGMNILTSKGGM